MIKEIDAKGLACPAPVIQTKNAVENTSPAIIRVIIDNEAAKQNILRFLESAKYNTSCENKEECFIITGTISKKYEKEHTPERNEPLGNARKIMVMVSSDRLGTGDNNLGFKLMENYIKTLKEMGRELWRLILVNSGVRLAIKDSTVLNDLKNLKSNGCSILVCGTCLSHFDILDKKEVGEITNMLDIVTSMQLADTVINI